MKKKNLEQKKCVFSVKIVADVRGPDDILVKEIKFAEMVEALDITCAFEKVREKIKQKAAHRGYPEKNGYRFQYHLSSPFKLLWETTAPLN